MRIICADAISADIAAGSINLTITSPPYNVDKRYKTYEDAKPYSDYLLWSAQWMAKVLEWTAEDGRLCLNIPLDTNKGGRNSVYADLVNLAQRVGWKYATTILWNEGNTSRRTAWGSWMSASAPYVIAPVEMIAVFYKEHWKRKADGISDIGRNEFMAWTSGVWTFNGQRDVHNHPAAFPLELPRRCIQLYSYVGDTVLDPFLGSGTTLAACRMLGREGIGIDIDETYCRAASARLERHVQNLSLFEATEKFDATPAPKPKKPKKKKVSFDHPQLPLGQEGV